MKNIRKKLIFLIIALIFIIAVGFTLFFTKRIGKIITIGKDNLYTGKSYSIEQNENAIKIQGDKRTQEEKEKDNLREKYNYLKSNDSGYERSMTDEEFEEFIEFAYKCNKEYEKNENLDYNPITNYLENVLGNYVGFEITEEMKQKHEENMKKLEEGHLTDEIQSEYVSIMQKTRREALIRNYGESYIAGLEEQSIQEHENGNYAGELSPADIKLCELLYELYSDQNKMKEHEIISIWDSLSHTYKALKDKDYELYEKIDNAIKNTDINHIGELQEKYKEYYFPRYDELYKK